MNLLRALKNTAGQAMVNNYRPVQPLNNRVVKNSFMDPTASTSALPSPTATTKAGTTAGTTAGITVGTTAGATVDTTAGTTVDTTAGKTAGITAGTTAGTTVDTTAGSSIVNINVGLFSLLLFTALLVVNCLRLH